MPVQMHPNMFQQVDYGRAVTSGQQIQHNRLRNQALGDEQEQNRNMLANRKKAQEIRQMHNQMPDQIAALEEANMFEQADQVRDQYIKTRKTEVDLLTAMRPNIDATNYKSLRQDLIQAGAVTPDMMPVEYSDAWFRKQIKEKRGALSKFTVDSFENGAIMSQDFVTQDGQIRWDLTGNPYDRDAGEDGKGGKGGSGKDFVMKAADASQIGKQIERMFGGFYDPATGKLQGLDPEVAPRVQAIQEEAEQIYNENQGAIPHGVAVTRAARKLGINIKNYRDAAATDPLSLRE